LLALGRHNPDDDSSESFKMANLAMRGSGAVNGVSHLHGKVSQRLFESLFSRWPQDEMPVGHVTNGVHMPGWDSAAADELLDGGLWKRPLAGDNGGLGPEIWNGKWSNPKRLRKSR
jgi:glucan phosphorylase